MSQLDLAGSVAVVTGGANGIGLAAARRFAGLGARLVLGDVDEPALEAACRELGAEGVRCDVAREADLARLAERARARGPVRVVMANAGVALGGLWEAVPLAEWSRVLDVNVLGVVRTIQPLLPDLLAAKAGHVVVTGSSAGLFGDPSGLSSPYATSKHALLGLTRTLATYLRPRGVQAHLLAPRITDTAFPRKALVWTAEGSRDLRDREVEDADTVEQVADALVDGMAEGRFLISLAPDTHEALHAFAETLEP